MCDADKDSFRSKDAKAPDAAIARCSQCGRVACGCTRSPAPEFYPACPWTQMVIELPVFPLAFTIIWQEQTS